MCRMCTSLLTPCFSCCAAGQRVPQFASLMPYNRFRTIKACLSAVPVDAEAPPMSVHSGPDVKLWKVKPLLEKVLANSRRAWSCGRFIAIDEMMIKSKGKCCVCVFAAVCVPVVLISCVTPCFCAPTAKVHWIQRIVTKPGRQGHKIYAVNDSEYGYVCFCDCCRCLFVPLPLLFCPSDTVLKRWCTLGFRTTRTSRGSDQRPRRVSP